MKTKPLTNREELEHALRGPGKKVVLFYSAWCPFCLSFMPCFEKQAAAAPDRFLKACTDDADELEDLFSIEVVPTVLCFEGGKLAKRLDGRLGRGLGAEELTAFIQDCCPEERKK